MKYGMIVGRRSPKEALEGGYNRVDIRPLTRSNQAGNLYRRSEQVEQQIQDLASLPDDDLVTHAYSQDKNSPEYIQEESLVYWIREYFHRGDSQRAGELAEILLGRCARWIQSKLRTLEPDLASQAEQDVVSQLFNDIFDIETNRGDFLQVRFWLTLERRIINVFKKYVRDANRTEPLAAPYEDSDPHDDDVAKGVDAREPTLTVSTIEQRELIRDALASIDEPFRTAFVLYHYHDWPTESKSAGVLTISSYFKKDPRTIRNWLRRAEQALSEWRNEE